VPVLQPAAVEQDAVDAEVLEGQRTVGDIEPARQLQGLLGFVQPVAQLSRGAHGRADGQVDARARPDVLGGGMDPVEQVRRDVQVSGQVVRGRGQQHQEAGSPRDDRSGTDDLQADAPHRRVKPCSSPRTSSGTASERDRVKGGGGTGSTVPGGRNELGSPVPETWR